MTVVLKNPLTPRRFKWIIAVILLVTALGIPTTLYWALQRSETHRLWDIESRYAQEFYFQSAYAAALLSGDVPSAPPTNTTIGIASNILAQATDELYNIEYIDTSHANTIGRITTALETLNTQGPDSLDYLQSLNSTQRSLLATQLRLLGHNILNAYWNYVNFTSSSPGVGPPFWYSGPSPPDSQLLQEAVNVALAIERK